MITIMGFIIYIIVMLIAFEVINYNLKKYLNERIKRSLELLNKLQDISKDIDNEIDGLKIMIYDRYLDRCRAGMKKQREEDKGLRDKLVEIENKYSKQQIHQTVVKLKSKEKNLIKKVLLRGQKERTGSKPQKKYV